MRALLVGQDLDLIAPALLQAGLEIVDHNPDVCVCHGGDGALLGAERDYPGIPKVPLRRRPPEATPPIEDYVALLRRVARSESPVSHLNKLEATCGPFRLLALNDVLIHNVNVTAAVRYRVEIDGVEHFGEIVGDGLVAATPFGSSAYYRSITDSVIHVGIGLAFNNSTEPVNHLVLSPESTIKVTITRGPALLAADNNPLVVPLSEGDVVRIRQAEQMVEVWEINDLLCMNRPGPDQPNGRRLRWLAPETRRNQQNAESAPDA
ncbi:MAG: kinase [Candidatus Sumerlaeota bacterium]|nr:kinase [Candidatus Sumerlaeota bacterium]